MRRFEVGDFVQVTANEARLRSLGVVSGLRFALGGQFNISVADVENDRYHLDMKAAGCSYNYYVRGRDLELIRGCEEMPDDRAYYDLITGVIPLE